METFRLIGNTMVFDVKREFNMLNGVPCVYGETGTRYKKNFATTARRADVENLDPFEKQLIDSNVHDPLNIL